MTMPTSMFDDTNGPAINKTHLTQVVDGLRKSIPDGWVRWEKRPRRTEYGVCFDVVYIYPDGREVVR